MAFLTGSGSRSAELRKLLSDRWGLIFVIFGTVLHVAISAVHDESAHGFGRGFGKWAAEIATAILVAGCLILTTERISKDEILKSVQDTLNDAIGSMKTVITLATFRGQEQANKLLSQISMDIFAEYVPGLGRTRLETTLDDQNWAIRSNAMIFAAAGKQLQHDQVEIRVTHTGPVGFWDNPDEAMPSLIEQRKFLQTVKGARIIRIFIGSIPIPNALDPETLDVSFDETDFEVKYDALKSASGGSNLGNLRGLCRYYRAMKLMAQYGIQTYYVQDTSHFSDFCWAPAASVASIWEPGIYRPAARIKLTSDENVLKRISDDWDRARSLTNVPGKFLVGPKPIEL